jgi:glucose/arabinose dehydrogenase
MLFVWRQALGVLLAGAAGLALAEEQPAAGGGIEVVPGAPVAAGVLEQRPGGPTIGGRPASPAEMRVTHPAGVRVEVVAGGLEAPWDLAWTPDGRLFVTERPGRVRVIAGGALAPAPWITFDVARTGEAGLMGMAVDPDFASSPWLYFALTVRDAGGDLENRVVRVREENGRAGRVEVVIDHLPGGRVHDGCQLAFGPDGKLYIATGETWAREIAQDPTNLGGKILRLDADGSIPADNPFGPESPVWSLGHRNPQGLAFDPATGRLWATEHGPSGEWWGVRGHDELNLIAAGKNYGWPIAVGAPGLAGYVDPVLVFPKRHLPPAGIVVCSGRAVPAWSGDLFFASLRGETLVRVVLDRETRTRPVRVERLFETDFGDGLYGRLRAVGEGPDGALYFGTSNRDGRGDPAREDDRILRIVAASR